MEALSSIASMPTEWCGDARPHAEHVWVEHGIEWQCDAHGNQWGRDVVVGPAYCGGTLIRPLG